MNTNGFFMRGVNEGLVMGGKFADGAAVVNEKIAPHYYEYNCRECE